MNQSWQEFQAERNKVAAKAKRKELLKMTIYVLVPILLFTGIMFMAASRYFAHQRAAETSQTQQVSPHDSDSSIEDGRILLIGIVVLTILAGVIAPALSGGRYNYTQMVKTIVIVGAFNLFVGQRMWNTEPPDPQDYVSASLGFCAVLGILDVFMLLVIAAFGWAARKDSSE